MHSRSPRDLDAAHATTGLGRVAFEHHHTFLLDTGINRSATVGLTKLDRTMAARPPACVVAVVDDDPSILKSLGHLLESADYKVRRFPSATALLESGLLSEIVCLISDIDMRGLDGFELARRVHAARPQLPIILITGYVERLERLPSFGGRTPRVFTKPFQGHELLQAVGDALRDSQR
jgi:FixJ family two-component response regulator